MKTWNVPVVWQMCGTYYGVKANTYEEAVALAVKGNMPLPFERNYVTDSMVAEDDVDYTLQTNELPDTISAKDADMTKEEKGKYDSIMAVCGNAGNSDNRTTVFVASDMPADKPPIWESQSYRMDDNTIYVRHWAADICGYFEDFLSEHFIVVPDEEREGDESEACLYGATYDETESVVGEALKEAIDAYKSGQWDKQDRKTDEVAVAKIVDRFHEMLKLVDAHTGENKTAAYIGKMNLEQAIHKELTELLLCVKLHPCHECNYDSFN